MKNENITLSGASIRTFRRALGKNQREFAGELGLSQATLSLVEIGKTPVSEDHVKRLRRSFNKPSCKPTFDEFVREVQQARRRDQAMLGYAPGSHAVLTVWRWRDDLDLSSSPLPEDAVGTVALRVSPDDAIAFQIGNKTQWWEKGEILVFARTAPDKCKDQDLCLVQIKPSRRKVTQTALAVARITSGTRGRIFQLQQIGPAAAVFAPQPDELFALLRCVYRAQYV